jgi:MFS superfamily sulfate permease-like transporter
VLRVESGLFFANAEHVRATIRQHVDDDTRAVVLDAETMPFVDVSAARMLEELADDLRREASRSSSRATSGRCATSCAARGRTRRSCTSIARSRKR